MLDCEIVLACTVFEHSADVPPARKARVERQRAIYQCHHRADVLAEMRERQGGIRKDAWVLTGDLQGAPSEIASLVAVALRVLARTIGAHPQEADRCPGECRPVARVAFDRLLEKTERRPKLFRRGYDLYDPVRVGFVTTGPEAERIGTVFDTTKAGGGNDGHLYGTELSDSDKVALIEYMKTL